MGFDFTSTGINFIKAESVTRDGEIDETTFAHIDQKTHEALKRSQIQTDDVLVTIAGVYLGKIGLVRGEHVPANTNQAVAIVRPDSNKVEPIFLKYFLQNKSTTTYLNMLCPQSAQPNLNLTQLGNLKLRIPPLRVQKKSPPSSPPTTT
jgi:type I restriction enzyme S subunit